MQRCIIVLIWNWLNFWLLLIVCVMLIYHIYLKILHWFQNFSGDKNMLFTYELNSENWISNSIGKDSFMFFSISIKSISVAMKIENGPKTNTKILRFLKIDRRRIRRIFVNSKILRRSSKIANSSNIFEDTKIFKGKWKIFVVKNFLSGSNLDKFSQQ